MSAPWCCLIALFEGYEIAHAKRCPYRREPQSTPCSLSPLSPRLEGRTRDQ